MQYLPKISIITPSFNQADFLERTILSVLGQNYPNLEYIIIDGKSSDKSPEIIKKYENQLHYWVSEKDSGQVEAINKGFKIATGDLITWVNSDDTMAKGTFQLIAENYVPEQNWYLGRFNVIDENENVLNTPPMDFPKSLFSWLNLFIRGVSYPVFQSSAFWNKRVIEECYPMKENLNYAFDHEFIYRIHKKFGEPVFLDEILSSFRIQSMSKTSVNKPEFAKELRRIAFSNLADVSFSEQAFLLSRGIKTLIFPKSN